VRSGFGPTNHCAGTITSAYVDTDSQPNASYTSPVANKHSQAITDARV
jgi:hypothetical protein